jgi:hypothetical protein
MKHTQETVTSELAPTVFRDDFADGLRHGAADDPWRVRPVGSLPGGDGVVHVVAGGIVVEPPGRDPVTGQPVFAPAEGEGTEHLRWAAFVNRTASTGVVGFDARPGELLTARTELTAQFMATERHPFGESVTDPDSDLRLGMAGMICVDMESGLVFDFILTQRRIYALYERLPRPNRIHATFSYAVPVATREPDEYHSFEVALDPAAGEVSWWLDGARVLEVDRLGHRALNERHLKKSDDAGPEETVVPRQLALGLGLFTDAVFGQGARLGARGATVRSRPV